jgi:hypothetical protein
MSAIRAQHLEANIKIRANNSDNKPKLRKHYKDV